jgi:hypothetical protein
MDGYLSYIKPKFWKEDYTILIWATPYIDKGGEHYTEGNKNAEEIYDPMNGRTKKIALKNYLKYRFI